MSRPSEPPGRLRPFFPTAADFSGATAPHFNFLVDELGFSVPHITDHHPDAFDVRFDGSAASVLLTWEVDGGYFGCSLIPHLAGRELDPDYEHWLALNEVIGARHASDDWVTQADFDDIDADGYARLMERQAHNLRTYCVDVLAGDFSIRADAQRWQTANRQ